MRRGAARLAATLLLAASLAVPTAARAEVVTPPASSFGLAPPQGDTDAPGFAGFANPALPGASIAITEFPPQAYAQLERGMDASRGIDMTARTPFATPAGDGLLLTGTPRDAGQTLAKWMLLVPARQGDQSATALIVVTLPGEATPATADAIRAFQPGPTLKPAHTMGRTSVVLVPEAAYPAIAPEFDAIAASVTAR